MKSLKKYFNSWLYPLVFVIWTGYLVYLLASQRYIVYLRPEFGVLLAVAHFVALGFMIAAIDRPKTKDMNISAVFRALVLLVPIMYSIAVPDAMLGNHAFKKRFIGINNSEICSQLTCSVPLEDPPANSDLSRQSGQDNMLQEPTILQLFLNPYFYKGQRVVVTGMILQDKQLKSQLGGNHTAIYRFLVNCCAADAVPLTIALNSAPATNVSADQWVKVDGIFDLQEINGEIVPQILTPQVQLIEAPAVPYLY